MPASAVPGILLITALGRTGDKLVFAAHFSLARNLHGRLGQFEMMGADIRKKTAVNRKDELIFELSRALAYNY